jgi:hypothetical protein
MILFCFRLWCSYWGFHLAKATLSHSRKYPYLPHRGNLKLTPLPPFGCPNTLTIFIRNNFFLPSPFGQKKFPEGHFTGYWSVWSLASHFIENIMHPMSQSCYIVAVWHNLKTVNIAKELSKFCIKLSKILQWYREKYRYFFRYRFSFFSTTATA